MLTVHSNEDMISEEDLLRIKLFEERKEKLRLQNEYLNCKRDLLVLQHRIALQEVNTALNLTNVEIAQAHKEHSELSAKLMEYHKMTSKCSYDPETGVIFRSESTEDADVQATVSSNETV